MTLELWNTLATLGTFVVIAASAAAALVQLRHMRGGNQIIALTELRETIESAEFVAQMRDVSGPLQEWLKTPEARAIVLAEPGLSVFHELGAAVRIANFFESAGVLVKRAIIDADLFCDLWGPTVIRAWLHLEELVVNRRIARGPVAWENFEYLMLVAKRYGTRYPNGTFPSHVKRDRLRDPWPEAKKILNDFS
jgi:hypothetical protein